MGYPTPDQIPLVSEATYRGICVYIPDKPEYLQALLGSLAGLSQWVVWQKDDNQSAKKSADLWKVANAMTTETWANDCGCGDDMTEPCVVTVNNYVTCGCGSSSPTTLYCVNDDGDVIVNPPPVTDDPVEPITTLPPEDVMPPVGDPSVDPPPDGWDDWESFDADACDAANTLVAWAIEASQRCCEFFTQDIYGITAVFAFFVNLYFGSWQIVLSGAFFLKLAELIRSLWDNTEAVVDLFCGLNDYLIENRQELVCMLYQNRENAADWENQLVTTLFQASEGGIASVNNKPIWLDTLKYLLPGLSSVGVLLGSVTYKGDKMGFLDCANCEDPLEGIECLPAGFQPVMFSSMAAVKIESQCTNVSVSGTYSPSSGAFQLVYTINPGMCSLGKFRADFFNTDPAMTNIRLWVIKDLAMTGDTTLNFEGLTLVPGAAPIDAAFRTDFVWTDCLKEYFTVDESVRPANDHLFFSTANVAVVPRVFTITGRIRAYNYVGE